MRSSRGMALVGACLLAACSKGETKADSAKMADSAAAASATAAAATPAAPTLTDANIVAILDGANVADSAAGKIASTKGTSADT